jgi:hypothetical protein
LVDEQAAWLALHEACLRELVPERIEAIYDEIDATPERDRAFRKHDLTKRLEELRREVDHVQKWLDGRMRFIPEFLRPGVRNVPIKTPPRPRWR